MHSSKVTFVDILLETFTDSLLKKKCIESSLTKINQNDVTRIFDDYPSLLSQEELSSITQNFQNICAQISEVEETSEKIQLANTNDKLALKVWEKNIADKTCRELLNKNGKIKSDIVILLGWEKHLDKINNCDLLCAYVGAVNHLVLLNMKRDIVENEKPFTAVCDYLNKNYKNWIIEVMHESEYPVDPGHSDTVERFQLKNILSLAKDHPGVTIGIGAASLLVTGLALTGILFFSSKAASESSPTLSSGVFPTFK